MCIRDRAQITRDHSLVASLVAAGALEPEDVYTHEQKAMIYRSVGEADDLTVDTFSLNLRPDDRLLLCSCLLYTSPSPRDRPRSRMPSSA